QNLTETLLLFCCGGAVGMLVAFWCKTLLAKIAAAYVETGDVQVDTRVLCFSAIATLVTGLLFGLLPALRAVNGPNGVGLQEVSGSAAPVRRNLARRLLVSSEFSLALVLLVVFGL